MSSFWQQAGRVGRRGSQATIVFIARDTPIDQYMVRHPEFLRDAPIERLARVAPLLPLVGEQGTFEIAPLEPPKVRMALDRPRGKFKRGFQDVTVPRATGRYDDEFRDLAKVIRGEKKLAWNRAHDLIVHEAVLRGSHMPID